MSSSPVKRVLCLHGWGSRPHVFACQLARVTSELYQVVGEDAVELVWVQAPHKMWMGKMDVMRGFGGPYYGWFNAQTDEALNEAIRYIDDMHPLDSFDAIIGFSQGATLALTIAAMRERNTLPTRRNPSTESLGKRWGSKRSLRPRAFDFVLAICPIVTTWSPADVKAGEPWLSSTPTLAYAGTKDRYVTGARETFDKFCRNASSKLHRLEHFEGAHHVPTQPEAIDDMVRFIQTSFSGLGLLKRPSNGSMASFDSYSTGTYSVRSSDTGSSASTAPFSFDL
ncbi:hypothetical protein BOTBODRAFT_41252 [Botryobasidium botryosum FD-172 SS1]|uniref:Serine hydrolase domain-containing protein n=1 Tax=Botryobasidium botryosum (strain FD-172 SS1) TaxID=930990 RepID=A0A067MWJ5_BOTB1|nr:hypothetical protein BOTBODRAFT_41252 [Botryobasidium botryosum FD-172 SS1]